MIINKIQLNYQILPISVNKAYMTRFGYRILSPEARTFKQLIEKETKAQITADQQKSIKNWKTIKATIIVSSDTWFTKKNTVRKKDIASFEKLLTDSVFTALEVDDSFIFNLSLIKEIGNPKIIYIIEEII